MKREIKWLTTQGEIEIEFQKAFKLREGKKEGQREKIKGRTSQKPEQNS